MKCPNCGAEMAEDRLYCEKCGEDIHIVPDFEPELESNMMQSIEHILEDVVQSSEKKAEDDGKAHRGGIFNDKSKRIKIWIALGVAALLLVVGCVKVIQYYSPDYQTERARYLTTLGRYDKAIQHYTRAMELDRFNVDLKLDIAEVYFLKNDKENYEYWLREIVQDPQSDLELLESAYGKLIAIYRAKGDYQTINEMLLSCESESVRTVYQSYLSEMPQFSVPAGEYDEVKALKLTVTGKGNIYYTVNGTTPDESSELYTTPILLENGDYIVRALFVNENGVMSDVAYAEYHINVEELEAPELNLDGGEYDTPLFITVTNDSENIYYTLDGTDPDLNSAQYTDPIPMPLGISTYKFARLESGRRSAIVERTFIFSLNTDFTPENAVDRIRENALNSGKIFDDTGHFDDTGACYQYQYLYVEDINNINAFYVVAEILVDAEGISSRTGNYFAVNAYTGYCYKLQNDNGSYELSEL